MWEIYKKDLTSYFSSLTAYVVIAIFLLATGLLMFVFPDTSLLDSEYATLQQLFSFAPFLFLFLIPAICMRSIAGEKSGKTFDLLTVFPVTEGQIVWSKFFAAFTLVAITLIPTVLYWYTVVQLGSPKGNVDSGGVIGSYIGLIMLSGSFTSIGILASSLSSNQIVAFLLGAFMCFIAYWGFDMISVVPSLVGTWDDLLQRIGISFHYEEVSKGWIHLSDVIYFICTIVGFNALSTLILEKNKW